MSNITKLKALFHICQLMKMGDGTLQVTFGTHVVYMNPENQIAIEMEPANRNTLLRIDQVVYSDKKHYITMLNYLIVIAKNLGYTKIYFADRISEKDLDLFKKSGFTELYIGSDTENHFLIKEL